MKKVLLVAIFAWAMGAVVHAQDLQISGGNNFSAAVCDNQKVFTWGANASGQLGTQTGSITPVAASYRATPAMVDWGNIDNTTGGTTAGELPPIRQIDAGSGAHLLGLSCSKQVWAWGENSNGQLGRANTTSSAVPTRVRRGAQASNVNASDPNGVFLNNIFYVSGGNNSSFALEEGTGRVLAWGQNANGQLGDGSTTQRTTPVYVVRSASEGGGQLTNIIQIEGGDDCTYALDANGFVWSWGNNDGNKLGRPGGGNQTTAARVVKGDPMNSGYGGTSPGFLNNIVQLSGGDTHALALDANGNVWSFGGDWGEGQLGRGGGSVYQDDARRVVDVGVTTFATAENQFLGNGSDGKAVYVSAGQASSAVVMANGRVVTFGARGLYNSGVTAIQSGSITCPGVGDMIPSGTLGDNNTGATFCNSTNCNGKASQWSRTPVYVRRETDGTILTGVARVSDGDAWYFAIGTNGTSAWVWGWNRRGELGLGDYVDRCGAAAFSLPSGCSFTAPCPGRPSLGPDAVKCPVFSETLNSQVPAQSSFRYTWDFRPGTSGSWTTLVDQGTSSTYSPANQTGQYRVTVLDNRPYVSSECGACPSYMDTITFTEAANPYTVTACADNATSLAQFSVVSPPSSQIKWYTNYTGGSALNSSNSDPAITVPFSSTNTTTPGCSRALYAEDISTYSSTLRPGTTVASAPCSGGSSQIGGDQVALMIEVTQNLTLTGVNFVMHNYGYNYSADYYIEVCNNNPTGNWCGDCSPPGDRDYRGATCQNSAITTHSHTSGAPASVRTIGANINLTPGYYWIRIRGGEVRNLDCSPARVPGSHLWQTPQTEATGSMRALSATRDNNYTGNASAFNITFNAGTGYTCGRILVCVSDVCALPVEFLSFTAEKAASNVLLNWTTAREENSSHFIVERSVDGINFSAVGQVGAAGNSSSAINYSYTDYKPLAGVSYYRLAQYDLDGSLTYSEIRAVSLGIGGINVIPNPNNGYFTVTMQGEGQSSFTLMLINAIGQPVLERNGKLESETYSSEMDISDLPAGIYYLQILSENSSMVKKIIKE